MHELQEAKQKLDESVQKQKDSEQLMAGMKSELDSHRKHAMQSNVELQAISIQSIQCS